MHLNFRIPFIEHKPVVVADKPEDRSEFAADTPPPVKRPTVLLFASRRMRERLASSTKYEFIPCGNPSPEILSQLRQLSLNGVLIQYEDEDRTVSDFIEIARKDFQDLPCCILCNQNNHRKLSEYGWQCMAVRDMTSLSEIEDKLQRVLFLFPWMKRDALRQILGNLKTIPTEAASHQRIAHELQNPQFDLKNVAELIKLDPALTVQLLKIVNSIAFSRGTPVQSVREAVLMLGAIKLQALVASAWAFFLIDDSACKGFHPRDEWDHAVTIADRVRRICDEEQVKSKTAETAIIAAMLHDVGKLLLAANIPHDYAKILETVRTHREPSWQVENQLLGFNHAEVAGCLLGLWNVPILVAQAVMLHHSANPDPASAEFMIQKAHSVQDDDSTHTDFVARQHPKL